MRRSASTATEARLAEAAEQHPLVLLMHFPLLAEHARIPSMPLFSMWCGTTRTAGWLDRFPVAGVVSGHLHRPGTVWRGRVWFEEVSLGYPHEWQRRPRPPSGPRVVLPRP